MKVLINLGEENSSRWTAKSRTLALVLKPILEALVTANQHFLELHPGFPLLYNSGVRYREEPTGQVEEFASIPVVFARKWGDCDDLAPWRVAELRRQGCHAKIRVSWKRYSPNGEVDPRFVQQMNRLAMAGVAGTQVDRLGAAVAVMRRLPKLYHVLVRREDGSIEDPSEVLGMRG